MQNPSAVVDVGPVFSDGQVQRLEIDDFGALAADRETGLSFLLCHSHPPYGQESLCPQLLEVDMCPYRGKTRKAPLILRSGYPIF